ncbi:choice-of-anchor D domain-containing protein [Microbispora sp. NEAU-D428]|nr:choice-of-anchor D domain-containing protein [Microbispora sitophila]
MSTAEPGPTSTVTWTATVTNKGDDAAADVRLDVLVPQAAGASTCETFRGICTAIKGGFRNTVKVLEPGWSATVEVTATIPADAADGTELKAEARGYSLEVPDPKPGDNAASVSATVRPLLDKTGVVRSEPVRVGSTSYANTVTLTNRLNDPIPLKAIEVEGPFSQSNDCPVELPVGERCVVSVTFTPTAEGAASGRLTFTTADGGEPAYVVSLSGTGAPGNAVPVIQVPEAPLKGTVGQPFTLKVDFTDADTADTHTAQVAWGDGPPVDAQVEQKAGGGTVTVTRTFAEPLEGAAMVMVTDSKGDTGWADVVPYVIDQGVPNAAPVVSAGGDVEIRAGQQWGRWATFTDDAGSTAWTASIDYGDRTGPQPVTLEGHDISMAHVWATGGTYTVTVRVKDDGGQEGTPASTSP